MVRENSRTVYSGILYGVMAAAVLTVSLVLSADILMLIYLLINIAGIYVNSLRNRLGLILFAAAAAIYCVVCFLNGFYGDFALNIAIGIYYIVFFFRWQKTPEENKINSFKWFWWLIILAVGAAAVPLVTWLLSLVSTVQPLINSLSSFFTVTAVILTAARTWQQYSLWLAVNIVQAALWITTITQSGTDYIAMIIVNSILLIINAYNLIVWLRLYMRQKQERQSDLA